MDLSGMGLNMASCSAYISMNGVISPGVSAGSNHVGAMVTCIAQVIWPEGSSLAAGAARSRGHPCSQAVSPATPPTEPCRKRRRVRDNFTCEESCVIQHLLWHYCLSRADSFQLTPQHYK